MTTVSSIYSKKYKIRSAYRAIGPAITFFFANPDFVSVRYPEQRGTEVVASRRLILY